MIRADRIRQAIFGQRLIARLEEFLQRRFVVEARDAVAPDLGNERPKLSEDERARLIHAAVQVDRRDERLVPVSQERLFVPAARFFLPRPSRR